MLPDTVKKVMHVQSFSKKDIVYTVSNTTEDGWECNCPHFIYRCKDTGDVCKHIELAQDYLNALQ